MSDDPFSGRSWKVTVVPTVRAVQFLEEGDEFEIIREKCALRVQGGSRSSASSREAWDTLFDAYIDEPFSVIRGMMTFPLPDPHVHSIVVRYGGKFGDGASSLIEVSILDEEDARRSTRNVLARIDANSAHRGAWHADN